MSLSRWRGWAFRCGSCLHFLPTVTVEGRIVVIILLPHPTPSLMEGINLGPLPSWASGSSPSQLNVSLSMAGEGKHGGSCFKGPSAAERPEAFAGIPHPKGMVLRARFLAFGYLYLPFPKIKRIEFSCSSVGKINELMFSEVPWESQMKGTT